MKKKKQRPESAIMEGSSSRKIWTRFLVDGVETDPAIETRDSTGEEEATISYRKGSGFRFPIQIYEFFELFCFSGRRNGGDFFFFQYGVFG